MNTHDIDLPPLPEWMRNFQIPADDQDDSDFNWLDWRMKEYARAAIEPYAKRITQLEADRKQPAAVDGEMMERIAALLYEETTGEPWTVADVKHYRLERDYYRRLAHKVAAIVHARRAEGDGK